MFLHTVDSVAMSSHVLRTTLKNARVIGEDPRTSSDNVTHWCNMHTSWKRGSAVGPLKPLISQFPPYPVCFQDWKEMIWRNVENTLKHTTKTTSHRKASVNFRFSKKKKLITWSIRISIARPRTKKRSQPKECFDPTMRSITTSFCRLGRLGLCLFCEACLTVFDLSLTCLSIFCLTFV